MDQYRQDIWDSFPSLQTPARRTVCGREGCENPDCTGCEFERCVEIGRKFFSESEAAEIDREIEKLDALMKARRERVLREIAEGNERIASAMAAEQCSCSACVGVRAFIREALT